MLRPVDSATRERRSLNGLWRFAVDRDGAGRSERWWSRGLPGTLEMPVPASYNDVIPEPYLRAYVGEVWYQSRVPVPRGWDGRVILRFDSATHAATVWINDVEAVSHQGGYTPFEVDVTDHVAPGDEARVTVAVDNRLSWRSIPPGVVDETPDGVRQRYFHDFFNYAGLHRSVWLYTRPSNYINDITVVTELNGTIGVIHARVDTVGPDASEITIELRDQAGEIVGSATGAEAVLEIADVHPWRPGEGYLYTLVAELRSGEEVIDRYSLPVGVRTVAVDGHRFLINGEPFYFRGFGKHEDLPVKGKGHDDVFMVHDFALMEWMGANSFRTSHYPYAEDVLDYADRHGFVVIDETPAVGINSGLAGGVFGAQPFTTFSPDTINEATQRAHRRAIEEMIARDKNHPCVVMWSIANEPESTTSASRSYFEPLAAAARELDPTRPIGFANVMGSGPEVDVITDLFDVIMLNRYYGWYADTGDLAAAERHLEEELEAWVAKYDKPIVFTEYGADALAGLHTMAGVPWTEEYQAAVLETFHRVFDRFDAVVGEHVWNFADFSTAPGILRVDGNKKGVFTRDRRPKASAHLLRRRWRGGS
jgi:beta-glucuronidase